MSYKHSKILKIKPDFDSTLIDLIIELDYLRKKPLIGTTHPKIFFQLKEIFHFLESLGSTRIEGNRTTLAEYVEMRIGDQDIKSEDLMEIHNVELALKFLDENIKETKINKSLLNQLHIIITKGLTAPPHGEGSKSPGEFRMQNVTIKDAKHVPPKFFHVNNYMEELFSYINNDDHPKYDLIKTAIAHHRFAWIHPYDNGNGRTVRLLTYAMLVKQGFKIDMGGRIINPTAVFCANRNKYNNALSEADNKGEVGLVAWCEYVLSGLKKEIEKIDKLLDHSYLSKMILLPTIDFSLSRKVITDLEAAVLRVAVKKKVFQAADIEHLFQDKLPAARSRFIRQMREKRLIDTETPNSRKYLINFRNNYLLRGIIKLLDEKGFLPIKNDILDL